MGQEIVSKEEDDDDNIRCPEKVQICLKGKGITLSRQPTTLAFLMQAIDAWL